MTSVTNPVTRLRAPNATNQTTQTLKPIPQEIDSRIATTLIKMENNGLTAITVNAKQTTRAERMLVAHLFEVPPHVKTI